MSKIIQRLTAAILAAVIMCCAGGDLSLSITAYAASSAKLPAPKKLTFYKGSTSVTVNWDEVSGADGYKVGRFDPVKKKYVYSKLTTGTSARISNLKESTSYKFVVASYDKINGKLVEQSVSKAFKCTTLAAPKSIKLSASSKSVTEKKSVTVKATVSPSEFKDVKWSISDGSVAEITGKGLSCKIVGLKEGTATLTAVAGNNKAACKITVKPTKIVYPTERAEELFPNSTYYFLDDTKNVKPLLNAAGKRKQEILNTKTEIVRSDKFIRGETYTGTAYYVSPNGDDDNDGLTPETAWRTIEGMNWRAWSGTIKEGDAVFFERGGVYRINADTRLFWAVSNVTYSAYGEGAKPVITLAQENSAREECWQLYYDKDGKKIWKFYKELLQTDGIVFDDETYAKRVLEWPTKKGWERIEQFAYDPVNGIADSGDPSIPYDIRGTGEYPSVEDNLTENLTFICRTDISDIEYPIDWGSDNGKWSLYLRCDEGNPGTLYNDIEVIAPEVGGTYHLIFGNDMEGFVLDNISMKYYADSAVFGNYEKTKDVIVQNCTVEWGGNRLYLTYSETPTREWSIIGDSIYGLANNAIIKNNYMRQSGNGTTFETGTDYIAESKSFGSYVCSGNVLENCGQGIRTYFKNYFLNMESKLSELSITDNYILYTGQFFNNACFENPCGIDLGGDYQFAEKINITNNVVIGSTLSLIRLPDTADAKVDFSDNILVQERGNPLAVVMRWIEPHRVEFIPFTE